jgi:D-alanine-D-alanine ligase-like ATP-grasp enzyme
MPAVPQPIDTLALRASPLIARAGRRGRRAAAWADALGLLGPGPLGRQRRELRLHGEPGGRARTAVYRRIWDEAAAALGAEAEDLGGGLLLLRRGSREVRVFHQITPIDDPVTLRIALDKPRVHGLFAAAGLAVPEHVMFPAGDPAPAAELLGRVGRCVVKPANGTGGGEGVVAGIAEGPDLIRAVRVAGTFDDVLLAERHAPGLLHRLLLLDGELLDVIADRPPHVVGDGRASVEELIAAENRRRMRAGGEAGLELLRLDLDTALTLRGRGAGLGTVPAPGEEIAVKSVTNDHRLEDSWTYRDEVHPGVLEQARAGAAAVGLRLAGVDVMAPRIDRPLEETGGVLLEVNGTPGFHRHYHVADRPSATRVAEPILGHMLAAGGDAG